MEKFSALLAICAGNSPVPGEFPAQRPVTRSFGVFFDLRLNKRLSKQSCCHAAACCTHRDKIRYLIKWPIAKKLHHIKMSGFLCVILGNYKRASSYGTERCSNIILARTIILVQNRSIDRIVKYLSIENRTCIYNAFLASNFSYCNTVWHFCSNRSLYKLEKVHKQALRVVLNDYTSSYSDLLTKMARPTLYVTRLKAIATEAYKSYANENPAYINAMLNPSITPYNLRGGSRAEQPKVNTTSCRLNTFSYQAAKLWNNLPSFIKEATSVTEFKSLLSKWPGPKCQCGYCVLCRIYNI